MRTSTIVCRGELFRGLHLQRVIEQVEIIEESNGGDEFYHRRFIVLLAQFSEKSVIQRVLVAREAIGHAESDLLLRGKVTAPVSVFEIVDLFVSPAIPSCQDGVRSQSIFAAVDLRYADKQQLFQLGGQRAVGANDSEVVDHGPEYFRTMGHRTEHVGNVAALLHEAVVDFAHFI